MPNRLRPSKRSFVHRLGSQSRSALSQLARLAGLRGAQRGHAARARRLIQLLTGADAATPAARRRLRRSLALGPLVLIALLFLFGRGIVRQRVDVEANVRRSLLPQLEQELGVDIEVGKIESDYLSRVVLRDVVIGRDKSLPLGALAQARTVALNLDVVRLLQHRDDPLSALNSVYLDEPQIYLQRDKAGKLNWQKILDRRPPGERTVWNGVVSFREGRVWYDDALIRNTAGRPLAADASGASGNLRFNGTLPTTLQLAIAQTRIENAILTNAAASGEFDLGDKNVKPWASLSLALPPAPAQLLASYAFPRRDVLASAGTIGGKLQLAYDAALPAGRTLLTAGDLALQNVTLQARALTLPNNAAPLIISSATGPLSFNGTTFVSSGLALNTLDSPLRLSGTFSLPPASNAKALFNVVVESRALATNKLAALLPRPLALSGGAARATLRFSGDTGNARIGGIVLIPDFQARHPQYGRLNASTLQTTLNFAGDLSRGRLNADITLPRFDLHTAGGRSAASAGGSGLSGNLRLTFGNKNDFNGGLRFTSASLRGAGGGFGTAAGEAARGSVRFAGNASSLPVAADLTIGRFNARSGAAKPRYGTLRGRSLRLVLATADARRPAWQGAVYVGGIDAGAIDIQSLAPDAAAQIRDVGLRDIGTLEGSARFRNITSRGLRDAVVNGTFHLSQATVQGTRLSDIYGQASLSNGSWNVASARAGSEFGAFTLNLTPGGGGLGGLQISAPRVTLDAARVNPWLEQMGIALKGSATGRLDVQSQGGNAFRAGFDFVLPQADLNRARRGAQRLLARLGDVRLRGRGILRRGAGNSWSWDGETRITAANTGLSRTLRGFRLGGFSFPVWFDGGKLLNLDLLARGGATLNAAGLRPRLSGSLSLASAALQLQGNNGQASAPVRLRNSSVLYAFDSNRLQASRIVTGIESFDKPSSETPARVTGHVTLAGSGELSGQMLAENIDTARAQQTVQRLLGVTSETRVSGTTFVRADVTGTSREPHAAVQVRLYAGAVGVAENSVPLDSLRLAGTFNLADLNTIPLEELTIWSRGARLTAGGTLRRAAAGSGGSTYALNLDAEMNDVRLRDVGLLVNSGTDSDTDGLVGGKWKVTGTLATPRVTGRTSLRLAQLLGIAVDEAAANLYFENTASGIRLGLSDISGRIGSSTFSGRLLSDVPQDLWRVQLSTSDIPSSRLLRTGVFIASRIGNEELARRMRTWQNVPLRGGMRTELDVQGSFRRPSEPGQAISLQPNDGTLRITTDNVRWKGRSIGTLTADAGIVPNGVRINNLTLRRTTEGIGPVRVSTGGRRQSPPDQDDESGEEPPAGESQTREPQSGDAEPEEAPSPAAQPPAAGGGAAAVIAPPTELPDALLQIYGLFPTSAEAETLDATIRVSNERLSFVQTMLREVEGSLRKQGELVPSLDAIVNGITTLPGNLEGLLNLDAHFTGSWQRPVIALQTAVLDARLGTEVLPTLNTSLVLDDGAVTVQNLEVRKVTPAAPGSGEDDRETVLRVAEGGRIAPGGEVSLDIELLNSNLNQLAQYIPGLRGLDGSSIVSGEISLFNLEVRGEAMNPTLTGSIEAENLVYRTYSLDRLRLTRFDIANGRLDVEPGNLTVVKGGFQSSAAWGNVPWDWRRPGPVTDKPMEVHLPLQTRDFGALAGTFIPALAEVGADNFSGTIDISGTIEKPHFAGEMAVEKGRFRADAAATGVSFGVNDLTGRLRFINGNTLVVDDLHGQLASANRIESAAATNNLPPAQRNRRAAEREAIHPGGRPPADIAGEFALGGQVVLDLDPRNFDQPGLSVAAHRYDLNFALKKASYSSDSISGVRDVDLNVALKTGEGEPAYSQNLTWQLQAAGSRAGKGKNKPGGPAGELASAAEVRLAPDFATGVDAFLHSTFRGDVTLRGFGFSIKDVAAGSIDGTLQLTNVAPGTPVTVPALRPAVAARVDPNFRRVQQGGTAAPPASDKVLGLSGTVVLSDTELIGAPIGGVGTGGVLPDAPVMGIRLMLGRNVRFVTSNLRADFEGGFDVGGTPRNPQIAGEIETKNGQIRFPSSNARITEGRIRFNVARDPGTDVIRSSAEIDATARGQAGRYQITLGLHGPLDFGSNNIQNLRVDVSSNPPLSQDEAFAQLTGTSLRDLGNNGDLSGSKVNQAYAGAVLSLISAPLFAGIERSLEEVLGLSSITLDYRFNEPLSVQFGKAVGDRVYISYRRSLSENKLGEATNYTLRIDYRIKGDWQLGVQFEDRKRQQISIDKTWRF